MKTFIQLSMIDRAEYDENETGQPIESAKPVIVQVDAIRCFYPRKGGRPGTRITFTDRGGFVVAESFETVNAAIGGPALVDVMVPLRPAPAAPLLQLVPPSEAPAEETETQH